MPTRVSRKKCLLIALLAVPLAGMIWIAYRGPAHPQFGKVYTSELVSSYRSNWQTALEKGEATARRWLHLRQRQPPPERTFQIGPALLECTGAGPTNYASTASIYLVNPLNKAEPLWEFALSTHPNLRAVKPEDLDCEFYGMNDPRGTSVFGLPYDGVINRTAWNGDHIRVLEGQVFLARLVTNRSTVYVVQLGKWKIFPYYLQPGTSFDGRIRARYVCVSNQF